MSFADASDHDLMTAFQGGDMDAYTELYQRHLSGLLNFFYRLSWDHSLSEDFTQETLVRVYRLRRTWTPQAKFTTFLYRVARNLWIDHVRSAYVRKFNVGAKSSVRSGDDDAQSFVERLPDQLRPPEDDLERRELFDTIMRALDQLPMEQRMVFVLAEIEGLRYQDISEILDVPVGTVKSRMHAAVGKLQGLLAHLDPGADAGTGAGGMRAGNTVNESTINE